MMRLLPLYLISIVLLSAGLATAQDTTAAKPVVGLRDNRPTKFALIHATVVTQPGNVVDDATVLVNDTSIVAVGNDVVVPTGYMSIDCLGRTVYPGLIDAYSETEVPRPEEKSSPHWNSNVTPQRSAHTVAAASTTDFKKLRSQGITARLVAPKHGIIKGNSSVVLTSDDSSGRLLLKDKAWQHLSLTVPKNKPRSAYPNSPMGAVALLRQTLYDATWYRDAWQAYHATPTLPRPEMNTALAGLRDAIANDVFVIDAPNERMALRAEAIAREFSLNIILRGSGREYRDLEAIVATGRPVLVPVAFADKPKIATESDAKNVSLQELMHWHLAPENPGRLVHAEGKICLTTDGLDNVGDFLKQVRVAISRGLEPDAALAAMTTSPAKFLKIDATTGKIRQGMLANFVITDGDLFDEKTKVLETWIAGKQFVVSPSKPNTTDALDGSWMLTFASADQAIQTRLEIQDKDGKLTGRLADPGSDDVDKDDAPEKETDDEQSDEEEPDSQSDQAKKPKFAKLDKIVRQKDRLTANLRLSELNPELPTGVSQLTLISVDEGNDVTTVFGTIQLPDGNSQTLQIAYIEPDEVENATDVDKDAKEENPDEPVSDDAVSDDSVAKLPLLYPLGAYGRERPFQETSQVLFRGATVWTCSGVGTLETADVLVKDGKIVAVGHKLAAPKDSTIVDARGKHITPGLIDCHSHMATDGGVNESGQAVTAEVRIGDFIDNSDINIYRQLAGGVTTSNILHGSANPIGGQNQVIKLRWGRSMRDLPMTEAPAGIKFALGENVKRNQSRYPNTRMGVEQIVRDQLLAARQYDRSWRDYHSGKPIGLPPRRDLQLDAILEIQRGERWIHCHSYRQDEIVAMLDLLEEFGIQIGTLQHILEGYKVADRMAKHGAMASAFSDWWAYKFEVFDAIPYNGALLHQQGIVVSFNSDDRELARHLNTEAAKAMKYGSVSAEEALKFVTLNPAKQLRIDQHVGSLEPDKQADLVIWSGPPLSTTSRCVQTWIDGQRYFDLESDREMQQRDTKLHALLVQKVINEKDNQESKGKKKIEEEEDRWARHDVFCTANGEDGNRLTKWEHQR